MNTCAAFPARILVAALLLAASGHGADRVTALSSPTLTAVDTHAHIFQRASAPVAGARYVPNYDATPAELFLQFAAHGISHGVLVFPWCFAKPPPPGFPT